MFVSMNTNGSRPKKQTRVLSVRVPLGLPNQLILISAQRKSLGLYPASQQDIVTEALNHWFKNHAIKNK